MFKEKIALKSIIAILFILVAIGIISTPLSQAQYWEALPPYNLLWPLWSPALSPVDTVTGLPVPLITQLTNNTILPVQPVLAWDPAQSLPWALYNIPSTLGGGLTYFSPFFGLNPWPPSYLLDSGGLPNPINLPAGFGALSPIIIDPFADFVSIANLYFLAAYPQGLFATAVANLLTPAEIWALPTL